jgi:uncharacterized membrane protein/protein-disulfide isomerase
MAAMTGRSRGLIVGFALLGLGAASFSTYVHHQLLTVPGYASVCDIGATLNCSQAYLSKYGSFRGIPVALGGVFFFAAVLVVAGVTGRNRSAGRESAPAYIFVLSTIGLAVVLYLAWASYFVLRTVCIMCAITYVSVIAIFIVSGGAVTFPMTNLPRRAARDIRTIATSPLALLIAAVFAGSAVAAVTLFPEGTPLSIVPSEQATPTLTDEQRRELEKWVAAQPRVDIPVPNDGAKVLVIKFSDFQCPACKATHDAYRGVLAKYAPTQVKFLLKHYPLEGECNSGVPQGNHFAACEAAAATVMARANNHADRMTDWLFANQDRLSPAVVKEGAKDVGGVADFDARYARALQEVRTDASLGTMLKVGSTPTFFINGLRVVGGVPTPYFEGLIELELKKAK